MSNYSSSSFDPASENTSWYKVYSMVPVGSTILDIGCSSGNFGEVLIQKKKCKVDGIEIDEKDAAAARKKLRNVWILNAEHDDLSDVPTKKYDLIYFGDVIEHLVDPVNTLKRIKPLLKDGGGVLFSIPNMGHVGVRLALLAGKFEYTETGLLDKTHLHFYTLDEVQRVFGEAGYAIKTLDFVQKDYPKALLREKLSSYGLSATSAFFDKMSHPEASAFQFVGIAKPSSVKKTKLKQFGPIDLFESYFTNTVTPLEKKIKDLSSKVEIIETENKILNERWNLLRHRPHKLVARSIAGRLRKKQ